MGMVDHILRVIREKGEASTAEIAEAVGASKQTVLRELYKMYVLGYVEPIKRGRRYYWRIAKPMAINPIPLPNKPFVYMETHVEPVFRIVGDRVEAMVMVQVRDREYWLCRCVEDYYVITDREVGGCRCFRKRAFGGRRLAMIYIPRELATREWVVYRYEEDGAYIIVLVPGTESERVKKKFEGYLKAVQQAP